MLGHVIYFQLRVGQYKFSTTFGTENNFKKHTLPSKSLVGILL